MHNLSEPFETFIPSDIDCQGRQLGYAVAFREDLDSGECWAWVQRSMQTAPCEWKDWGARQRPRKFPSLVQARTWAYDAAKKRASKRT